MTLYRGRYRVESARRPGWDYAAPGWYFVTLCTHRRARVLGMVLEGRVRLSEIGRIVADEWRRTPHVRVNVALDAWVIMPDHLHGIIRILPPVDERSADDAAARNPDYRDGSDATHRDADIAPNRNVVETPRRGVSTVTTAHGPDAPAPTVAMAHGLDATAPPVAMAQQPDAPAPTAHGSGTASPPAPTRGFSRGAGIEPPAGDLGSEGLGRPRLQAGSLGAIIGQFKSQCTKRIGLAGHDDFAWQARFYDSIIRDRAGLLRVRRYIAANPVRWEIDRNRPVGPLM